MERNGEQLKGQRLLLSVVRTHGFRLVHGTQALCTQFVGQRVSVSHSGVRTLLRVEQFDLRELRALPLDCRSKRLSWSRVFGWNLRRV